MEIVPKVLSEPDAVRARLAELGLDLEVLHGAVLASETGRARASANHPPITGGFNGWADGVAALRDGLLPLGWTKSDVKGYSTSVSADGYRQIAVASGDRGTGDAGVTPRTKTPKGPVTVRAVKDNNQLFLWADLGVSVEMPDADDTDGDVEPPRETWLLLVARTRSELRAELSRPATMDEDDRVATWLERVILPPIDLDDAGKRSVLPAPEPGQDFDVTVTRRVG